jgi:MoxR-like ATPase
MYIGQAKHLIKSCIIKKVYIPFLVIGPMGVGKSEIQLQVAQELGINFVDLRLAQQEPGDLIGVPRSDDLRNVTVWRKPEWWPLPGSSGIIHLDELNRAPTDVRQAVFQLVKERRLHTHVLPDGWFVNASINPDNSTYQVEQLDKAMLRRFCQIKAEANVEDFIQYWHKRFINDSHADLISRFILTHESLLANKDKFEIVAEPSPDAWRMVQNLLSVVDIDVNLQTEVLSGLVGTPAAVAFIKFMDKEYVKPVSGKEILTDFNKVKEQLKKQADDNGRMYATNHDLIALLLAHQDEELPKDKLENFVAFMKVANEETKSTIIMSITPSMPLMKQMSQETELVEQCIKFMKHVN